VVAVRPFAYTGSVLAVLFGLALAYYDGFPIRWGLFALTVVGVACFHTAANLLNDCFDYLRGLDRQVNPVSGAVVRGLITPWQAFRAAALCLVVGVAIGLYLTSVAGWVVFVLGVVGTALVLGYTTPGFCLKFAGLGSAAIFLAFGALSVFGTYYVQTRTFSWMPILWSVPVVLLTVGILHGNNWRDIGSDPAQGCRTLASRLGDRGSAVVYHALVLGPFAFIVLYFLAGLSPATAFLGFLALPMAVQLLRNSGRRHSEAGRAAFLALDAQTAKVHLVFCSLLTAAFFLSTLLPAA
jgi:1,4-dihydroxy-2-naphthoate octaprenyltransferase